MKIATAWEVISGVIFGLRSYAKWLAAGIGAVIPANAKAVTPALLNLYQ